jgi:hypothetical protein
LPWLLLQHLWLGKPCLCLQIVNLLLLLYSGERFFLKNKTKTFFLKKYIFSFQTSESMEPAFQRGDLLFLSLGKKPFEVGDIPVFRIKGKEIPIVHRLMEIHHE